MADAVYVLPTDQRRLVVAAAVGVGEVWQRPDGRAEVYLGLTPATGGPQPASSGDDTLWKDDGKYTLTKTTGIVLLDGGEAYWDHSANSVTYKSVSDRDFYLGTVVGDAGSTSATCVVDLNKQQANKIDINRDAWLSVPVGTKAYYTMGIFREGGTHRFNISSTNEAQKLDILSLEGFDKAANAIVEFSFRVPADGASTAVDVSLGVANATHTTDADSITESVFIHLDENTTTIYAESDDGTTEVAATDTTKTYTEGSSLSVRKEVWFDFRNPADVQIYIDGVNVLPSSVFNVNAATGPFYLLAHIEKTSSADTYELLLDKMRARIMEQ